MKLTAFILLLCFWLVAPTNAGVSHKFYLSLAQIEHNTQNQSLEISLKLFTDDLERCVGKQFRENLKLGDEAEHPQSDQLIENYLKEKLRLKCDGKDLQLVLIGKEVGVEETWCYIEVALNSKNPKTVEIDNRIFLETYSAQVNMVKFSSPTAPAQDLSLNKQQTTGTINL
jgi:hypothetical protein